jgi:hypothetical protein
MLELHPAFAGVLPVAIIEIANPPPPQNSAGHAADVATMPTLGQLPDTNMPPPRPGQGPDGNPPPPPSLGHDPDVNPPPPSLGHDPDVNPPPPPQK